MIEGRLLLVYYGHHIKMSLVDLKAYSLAKLAIDKKFYGKLSSLECFEVHAPQYPCTPSAIDGCERATPDI
jgi:hypothetical protein